MVGVDCFAVFKDCGYKGAIAAESSPGNPGFVPPGVILMRLLEYANSASFTKVLVMESVHLPMTIFEGCDQLPFIVGNGESPEYWLPLYDGLLQLSCV